jgi:D-alanyl-D-alanine dipeptidase
MSDLHLDLRSQEIPPLRQAGTALDYHTIPIDFTNKLIKEPLVKLSDFGIASRSAYARANAPYYRAFDCALPDVYVRETLAKKMSKVNELLKDKNMELLALDGFRSIELQLELWNHFIARGRAILEHPSEQGLVEFAGTYCSDPRGFDKNDYRTWSTHNTGGAIDLTLQSISDQQELFMGSIFDDADSISSTRYFENLELVSQSAIEARANRRVLYHAMVSQGCTNYHHEWWHFEYGTQMWIMNGGEATAALYGRAEL